MQRACGGADVIVDGLGEPPAKRTSRRWRRRGHWISLGQASGALPPIAPDALVAKSSASRGRWCSTIVPTPASSPNVRSAVWDALGRRPLKTPPIERYSLDAAAQAHARLESRASIGALILVA